MVSKTENSNILYCEETTTVLTPDIDNELNIKPPTLLHQAANILQQHITKNTFLTLPKVVQNQIKEQAEKSKNEYFTFTVQ